MSEIDDIPLVLAIFCDGSFEDFILGVLVDVLARSHVPRDMPRTFQTPGLVVDGQK